MENLRFTRDGALLVLGASGFLHEVWLGKVTERPLLLALCGALMGLPFVLRAEEKVKRNGKDS